MSGSLQPREFDTERLAFRVWQDRHREPYSAMSADPEEMRYFPSLQTIEQSNANADFDHPGVPQGHPIRRHCLYRIFRTEWLSGQA